MCQIIGRKQEIAELNRAFESGRAEFVAVYGRRRVGKTFLINEVFRDNMTFRHTGLSPYDRTRKVTLRDQLQNFHFSLIRHGMEGGEAPRSWMEAFFRLEQFLERQDNGTRQVVFIDELPWMDTPRSGFLTALEAFWNGWACSRHNICFVVCIRFYLQDLHTGSFHCSPVRSGKQCRVFLFGSEAQASAS